jgi:hypothetical protein
MGLGSKTCCGFSAAAEGKSDASVRFAAEGESFAAEGE